MNNHTLVLDDLPESGATLLEMLVVIAIVAMAIGIAMPSLGKRNLEGNLTLQAAGLVAELRRAQARAVATDEATAVEFDLKMKRYSVLPAGPTNTLGGTTEIEYTVARQAIRDSSAARIVFFGDGSSSGGRITLRHAKLACNIDVLWLSGTVVGDKCRASP